MNQPQNCRGLSFYIGWMRGYAIYDNSLSALAQCCILWHEKVTISMKIVSGSPTSKTSALNCLEVLGSLFLTMSTHCGPHGIPNLNPRVVADPWLFPLIWSMVASENQRNSALHLPHRKTSSCVKRPVVAQLLSLAMTSHNMHRLPNYMYVPTCFQFVADTQIHIPQCVILLICSFLYCLKYWEASVTRLRIMPGSSLHQIRNWESLNLVRRGCTICIKSWETFLIPMLKCSTVSRARAFSWLCCITFKNWSVVHGDILVVAWKNPTICSISISFCLLSEVTVYIVRLVDILCHVFMPSMAESAQT